MVAQQMWEMYQQYFASAEQAVPWLFSSLAALLDSFGGSNSIAEDVGVTSSAQGQGTWPGQGLWNLSILNQIAGQVFGPFSQRQGDLPSLQLDPTCLGEGEETESCSMAFFPFYPECM